MIDSMNIMQIVIRSHAWTFRHHLRSAETDREHHSQQQTLRPIRFTRFTTRGHLMVCKEEGINQVLNPATHCTEITIDTKHGRL